MVVSGKPSTWLILFAGNLKTSGLFAVSWDLSLLVSPADFKGCYVVMDLYYKVGFVELTQSVATVLVMVTSDQVALDFLTLPHSSPLFMERLTPEKAVCELRFAAR